MANYEATRYNFDGENLTDIDLVNTGLIIPWTDSSIPSGFLECNGQAVSRSTYAALFSVVGTTYGSGNGSTTFNVPDLQDDVPVGKSPNKALASTGGTNTATNTGNIGGSAANKSLTGPTIASHSHNVNRANNKNAGGNHPIWDRPSGTVASGNKGGGGGHSHPLSANFSGSANSILQPYVTVIYVIKT